MPVVCHEVRVQVCDVCVHTLAGCVCVLCVCTRVCTEPWMCVFAVCAYAHTCARGVYDTLRVCAHMGAVCVTMVTHVCVHPHVCRGL